MTLPGSQNWGWEQVAQVGTALRFLRDEANWEETKFLLIKGGRLIFILAYIITISSLISESHSKNWYFYGKHRLQSIAFYKRKKKWLCYICKACGLIRRFGNFVTTYSGVYVCQHSWFVCSVKENGEMASTWEGSCSGVLELKFAGAEVGGGWAKRWLSA